MDELFFIKEYYNLRNTVYNLNYNNSKYNDKNKEIIDYGVLKDIMFCNYRQHCDGTLLHKAIFCNLSYYCDLLLNDGFDVHLQSRFRKNDAKTPLKIANRFGNASIKSLLSSKLNVNWNDIDGVDDDSKVCICENVVN